MLRELVRASTGVELHEDRLTIGFARRFATYKRANLVFSDLERLRASAPIASSSCSAAKPTPKTRVENN